MTFISRNDKLSTPQQTSSEASTVSQFSAGRPAIFAVSAVVLLGGILAHATIQSEKRQDWAERAILHTERVIDDLHVLEGRLIESEDAERGFLLTNDSRSLTALRTAEAAATNAIARLRTAVSDPLEDAVAESTRLAQVERLASSDIAEMDRIVDLQQAGQSADAVPVARGRADHSFVTQLRDMIAAMVTDEQRHLASRLAELNQQAFIAVAVSVTGSAFAAVLMAIAFGLVVQYASRQTTVQRALRTEHDIAMAADKAKSRFLATASHDLRQPLHAMHLFVSALRRRVSDPEATQLVAGIGSAAESMQMMFNSLLDVSKLHAGVVTPNPEDFPLQSVFGRLYSSFVAPATAKGIGFSIVRSAATLHTDPVLLESILRNLISNAIRYTRRGEVSVLCDDSGDAIRIDVCDTGPGIPAEQIERAFEEFQRLDTSASGEDRGLGLGLAIVRRLANLLDLPVEVHSEVGVGTTFSVVVPRGTATPLPEVRASRIAPLPDHCRILVVEDDALVRSALAREIADWGATALLASNAEAALSMVQTIRPDLAIIDHHLGKGLNGAEFLKLLHERFDDSLPAIIITGSTDPEVLEELRQSGALWTTKPVDAHALRAEVTSLLVTVLDLQPIG